MLTTKARRWTAMVAAVLFCGLSTGTASADAWYADVTNSQGVFWSGPLWPCWNTWWILTGPYPSDKRLAACTNGQSFAQIDWATGTREWVMVQTDHKIVRTVPNNPHWTQLGNGVANSHTGAGIRVLRRSVNGAGRVTSITLKVYGTDGMYCVNGDGRRWSNWYSC
ncbi:hypothetical protein Lesp02_22760 [Lentzea sp. NBRC 105346]|uniref:hypothetical protein n=1 Tax=Lentzea sp. NBRC 105346 TaxID=3032205 RepID=UPI0024A36651|nr:hypothetical protein [Lentzea sp. NBRC 105346]GLZ30086.1 hypothetical protein Lesp02_22760 [Lentzea sp. NBRC 105346]